MLKLPEFVIAQFEKGGYTSSTVSKVTRLVTQAGITKDSFYQNFKNSEPKPAIEKISKLRQALFGPDTVLSCLQSKDFF